MKHSIQEIRDEYNRLDRICHVDTSGIAIKISKRAISRYGTCHLTKNAKGKYAPECITIADFILTCDEAFWDVIRHEYAHAVASLRDGKNHGHDAVWKSVCIEVGCNPERLLFDHEAKTIHQSRRKAMEKYRIECRDCGRIWKYTRAGTVVKRLRNSRECTCPCGSSNLLLIEL